VARASGFYFRLTVPAHLRARAGKREIVKALPATSRRHAQRIANRLSIGLEQRFAWIDRGDVLTAAQGADNVAVLISN